VHLETAPNLFASRPDVKSGNVSILEGIHYSRKSIYNSAKTYQINKGEILSILCLQAFNLAPKIGRLRLATRRKW